MRWIRVFALIVAVLTGLIAKTSIDRSGIARKRTPPSMTLEMAEYQSDSLRRFAMGFNSAIGGFLWVKLLQDASHEKMTSGEVSWEYVQINSLLGLDPEFNQAYNFGSTFLSIFRQDKIGAKRILTLWTQRRPNYWRAHYTLGYHLFNEMNDYEAAAKSMLTAARLANAPSWLSALGLRLLSESGATFSALEMSLQLYSSAQDIESAFRIKRRIRSLRFAMERSRWERALLSYRRTHHREPQNLGQLITEYNKTDREIASQGVSFNIPDELAPLFQERFPFYYDAQSKSIRARLRAEDRYLETAGIIRKATS